MNGIKLDLFQKTNNFRITGRKEFNIKKNAYVIGHVGRFTEWKGQLKLVEAFVDYSKQNPKAILFLVGAPTFDSDVFKKIKSKISHYDLNDKIILTGFQLKLNKMYSIMDMFIYPSLEKDTSPLALLGALGGGLPVALSSIESLQEIIEIFSKISTFNPYNKHEIINTFQDYEDEQARIEMSKSIKKEFEHHFNMGAHMKNILEVLNKVK